MQKNQSQRFSMMLSVMLVVDDNILVWQTLVAFANAFGRFKNKLIDIETTDSLAQQIIIGVTKDKKTKRKTMTDTGMWVKGAVQAFAKSVGDTILFDSVNFAPSKLLKGKSSTSLSRARVIYEAANANIASLADFGITAAGLVTYLEAITDFESAISAPKAAISSRAVAHRQLAALLNDAGSILKDEMDKLMANFKVSAPGFYALYFQNRKITNIATHHTAFKLTITDENGNPVTNATVHAASDKLTYDFSSWNGLAEQRVHPSLYNITVEKPGFQKATLENLNITLGKMEKIQIKLIPLSPG